MTALSATCYFRVIEPIHFPVRADAGEYLGVWSGPNNLSVHDDTGAVLRWGCCPEAKLWTVLDGLLDSGRIKFLYGAERAAAMRPRQRSTELRLVM